MGVIVGVRVGVGVHVGRGVHVGVRVGAGVGVGDGVAVGPRDGSRSMVRAAPSPTVTPFRRTTESNARRKRSPPGPSTSSEGPASKVEQDSYTSVPVTVVLCRVTTQSSGTDRVAACATRSGAGSSPALLASIETRRANDTPARIERRELPLVDDGDGSWPGLSRSGIRASSQPCSVCTPRLGAPSTRRTVSRIGTDRWSSIARGAAPMELEVSEVTPSTSMRPEWQLGGCPRRRERCRILSENMKRLLS